MRSHAGFTTVELLVAAAILGILVAIGVPALSSFMTNGQIRTVGESLTNALTLARAEAARLNTQVALQFDGTTWSVYRVDNGSALFAGTGREGGQPGLQVAVTPSSSTTITFDAFGRRATQNADGSAPITQLDIRTSSTRNAGSIHPLRIQLLASGLSRLCDPSYPSSNAKACL